MTRKIGLIAFWVGAAALIVMLAIDVFGFREVPTVWLAGLAIVLAGVMWTMPVLRPQIGRRSHG